MMKQRTKNIIDTIIAVVIAAIFLFPMYWIIISSLKSDTEILRRCRHGFQGRSIGRIT